MQKLNKSMNDDTISNLNQSGYRSALDISQDFTGVEDSFLSTYGGKNLAATEVSFYGSNAELSVRHTSCLSQTMNEDGYVMINNYRLMNGLGKGSFGKVVKARHKPTGNYYVRFRHFNNSWIFRANSFKIIWSLFNLLLGCEDLEEE